MATDRISHSSRPLLHEVIPVIDLLTRHLDTFRDNDTLLPVIRQVSRLGLAMLNKYYQATDSTPNYRIAMSKSNFYMYICIMRSHWPLHTLVLHPAYKTRYFEKHGWPQDWRNEAVELVRREWATRYRPSPNDAQTSVKGKGKASLQSGSGSGVGGSRPRVSQVCCHPPIVPMLLLIASSCRPHVNSSHPSATVMTARMRPMHLRSILKHPL